MRAIAAISACAIMFIALSAQAQPDCWRTRLCTSDEPCQVVLDNGIPQIAYCGTGCDLDYTAEGSVGCTNRGITHHYTPEQCAQLEHAPPDCRYYCSEAVRVGIGCCTTTCPDPLHGCRPF